MGSGRKIKCAVLMPTGNNFAPRLLTGVYQFADEHPAMELVELPFQPGTPDPLPAGDWGFAGALLWVDRRSGWVPRLAGRGVAAVNCNRDWRGQPGVVSVGIDLAETNRLILDHLTAGGRVRQVAAIGTNLRERPHTAEKCHGMLALAASRGLPTALYEFARPSSEGDREMIVDPADAPDLLAFLRGLQQPAGVWCEIDYIARLVCDAARHLGLDVPDQLSVLGGGDHRVAVAGEPTISTMPRRPDAAGYAAAETLYGWLAAGGLGRAPQPPDVVLPPAPVIARQSTGGIDRVTLAVDEARRIIEVEACGGLTVDALCRRLDVSKVTLTARFSALMGVSPGAHIRRTKVAEAKRLLRESRLSVGDVGAAVGLSDHSKFSKFFKRETGLTPGEFRGAGGAGAARVR